MLLSACATVRHPPKAFVSNAPAYSPAAHDSTGPADPQPVVVAQEVLEGFQFLYRFVTETEFVLCLEGESEDGRLYVHSFRLARIKATTANSVRYDPCTGKDYVGTAHNHPPTAGSDVVCYQSLPDRHSFHNDQRASVDIVLCGERKYMWVLKDGRRGVRGVQSPR